MSDRYNHLSHGVVDVLRRFDHYWIARSGDGATHHVRQKDLHPIAEPIQFPAPQQQPEQSVGPETEQLPEAETETVTLAEINRLSANQLANALPGVGKLKARQILAAKPEGGFAAFDELRSALPEDFLTADEWAAIEPLISYAS